MSNLYKPIFQKPYFSPKLASENFEKLSHEQYFKENFVVDLGENFKVNVFRNPQLNNLENKITFVFHHGAGLSALSFGLVANKLRQLTSNECAVIAYDARAHGETVSNNNSDLSLNTLTLDLIKFITQPSVVDPESKLILIGHSLGGAVVVEAAHNMETCLHKRLLGVVVIDVVEGTAIDALPRMLSIVAKRPTSFKSLESAIGWSISSNTLKNLESARLSIPSQLKFNQNTQQFEWITDLFASQPNWETWFKGLSQKFLTCKTGKLLILAVTERLDKDLTIGQMQGKFQLHIANSEVGHNVHEDDPTQVANWLLEFWKRNDSFK
jgi:protein phosphatase methylesterase 1